MSELGYDFLVVALKTVVVCKVFRFMVEAEERCVVAGVGVVLYVAEKVEVVCADHCRAVYETSCALYFMGGFLSRLQFKEG